MADEDADLAQRVDSLETGQGRILAKLDELIGGAHAKAEQHEEDKLGRPTDVAEQVRLELERKEREAAEQADKAAKDAEHESIKERLAKLAEVPPVQPQPRRQRLMWGKR